MSDLSANAQQKVLELTKAYIGSFPEKINQLEGCWQNIEESKFAEEGLTELRSACHKIAGSSGSYNLLDISNAAKAVEHMSISSHWQQAEKKNREQDLKAGFQSLIGLLQNQS